MRTLKYSNDDETRPHYTSPNPKLWVELPCMEAFYEAKCLINVPINLPTSLRDTLVVNNHCQWNEFLCFFALFLSAQQNIIWVCIFALGNLGFLIQSSNSMSNGSEIRPHIILWLRWPFIFFTFFLLLSFLCFEIYKMCPCYTQRLTIVSPRERPWSQRIFQREMPDIVCVTWRVFPTRSKINLEITAYMYVQC